MQITRWQMEQQEETAEVSAEIDGFRLWYRVPKSCAVSRAADPFLAAALLPAMAKDDPLEVDRSLPVSPRFLTHAETLQEIYHCWNPVLKKISIRARTAPSETVNAGTCSFFSGGVDSMYTLLTRASEITHAVFIQGFDFFVDPALYQVAIERNAAFVRDLGKTLIPVQTNYYPFGYRHHLSILLSHGSTLASVALLLGFPRVYVPSTCSYAEMVPLGSHPLTDPLWSSDAVALVHDGAEMRRPEKLPTIVECPSALAHLRVCAQDMNTNCGRCEKCLRTMIPLRVLGVEGPFPPFRGLRAIRKMRIDNNIEKIFLAANVAFAQQSRDRALQKALGTCLRRYERWQLLRETDRVLGGGYLRQTLRRRRVARWGLPWINIIPEDM